MSSMFRGRRYRGTTNLLSTLGDRVRGWNFLNSAERAKIRDFGGLDVRVRGSGAGLGLWRFVWISHICAF